MSFESTSPDLAALAANALVNNYIEYNFHTKYDATRQATGWMEQQLDELKLKVEKSQQALVNYERQNSIVNIGDKESVAQGRLDDLNKNLTATQTERLQKQSVYEMVQSNESLVSFLEQNGLGLLSRLEEKESDLREQLAEATAQYGPNHPKMIRLQEQQKNLDSLIDRERKRMVENIRNDYLAAVQREKLLADAVAQEKLEVGRVSQLLIEHNLLKRDFDSNQQLYESLLQHLKDANVSAGLRATNIHLIDAASVPTAPVRPQRARNVAFAMAVGLALGMGMAFAKEALANSIKGAQEVESLIAAPALAIVPDVSSMARSGFFAKRSEAKAKKAEMDFRGISHPSHLDYALDRRTPAASLIDNQLPASRGEDFDFSEPGLHLGADGQPDPDYRRRPAQTAGRQGAELGHRKGTLRHPDWRLWTGGGARARGGYGRSLCSVGRAEPSQPRRAALLHENARPAEARAGTVRPRDPGLSASTAHHGRHDPCQQSGRSRDGRRKRRDHSRRAQPRLRRDPAFRGQDSGRRVE